MENLFQDGHKSDNTLHMEISSWMYFCELQIYLL